jgi:hypothetical protein
MTILQRLKVLERTKMWSCVETEPKTEIDYAEEGQQQSTQPIDRDCPVSVTVDGVWIGNWIIELLQNVTSSNYNAKASPQVKTCESGSNGETWTFKPNPVVSTIAHSTCKVRRAPHAVSHTFCNKSGSVSSMKSA